METKNLENSANEGMTRSELIEFAKQHGIRFSENGEPINETIPYSGSFASIYDFRSFGRSA